MVPEETLTLCLVMEVYNLNLCSKVLRPSKISILEAKFPNLLYLNHWSDRRKEFITHQMVLGETLISSIPMAVLVLITKKVIELISKITRFYVTRTPVLSTPPRWTSSETWRFQALRLTTTGLQRKQLSLIVQFLKVKKVQLIDCPLAPTNLEIQLVYKWTETDWENEQTLLWKVLLLN